MTGWQDALGLIVAMVPVIIAAWVYIGWRERRIRREVSETLERHRLRLPPDVERPADDQR